jgi:predicted chitinase
MSVVLLQQQAGTTAIRPPPIGEAWAYWTAVEIARCAGSPPAAVEQIWPMVFAELRARGAADKAVQAAAIATIAIETAYTFQPVRESYYLFADEIAALRECRYYINPANEQWRARNHRYYPFYGRGLIQLTWNGPDIWNYREYGQAIGIDLVSYPDRALEAEPCAAVLAEYFVRRDVAGAARAQDWPEVRRRVQGGHAEIERLREIVGCLGF